MRAKVRNRNIMALSRSNKVCIRYLRIKFVPLQRFRYFELIMKFNYKKFLPHIAAMVLFIAVGFVYFSPVLDGKKIFQSDMSQFEGGSKDLADYEQATGEKAGWTDGMFSGMPAYQLVMPESYNIFKTISTPITLGGYSFSVGIVFLLMLGFYIFMISMGAKPLISAVAALAYALGSYNIIIIAVGHITKAWAMAMMAPVLGGMIMVFRRKRLAGAAIFTVALGLQINFNHIQITYYTMLAAFVLGICFFVYAVKDKRLKDFAFGCGILVLCAIVSLMPNSSHLKLNSEYVKHTMRGGSELTVKTDKASQSQNNSKGLSIDYAYAWSYGLGESFSVIIPDFKGGGSSDHRLEKLAERRIQQVQTTRPAQADNPQINSIVNQYVASTYWGEQPFTAGTVYFGAIVCFLALLGFILLDGRMRWWLVGASVLSFILAWGGNAMWINKFLFEHLPFYDKFRTPSMALVIANVTMVMAAFLGLKEFLYGDKDPKKKRTALYVSAGITAGFCLLCAIGIIPSLFMDFSCSKDSVFQTALGDSFIQALHDDRQAAFTSDAFRSFCFIAVAFVIMILFSLNKVKKEIIVVAVIGLACAIDLWGVDRRYLDKSNFQKAYEMTPQSTSAIEGIKQQVENQGINHYRVYNMAVSTFNDASTSYFFPSIGGYHGAKLQRYQEIIDFCLQNRSYVQKDLADTALLANNQLRQFFLQYRNMVPCPNLGVVDMLDAKFFILPLGEEGGVPVYNPEACGAAWFVPEIKWAASPDEEILALDNFNPRRTIVLNKKYKSIVKQGTGFDEQAKIELEPQAVHNPDYKKYTYTSNNDQMAVFSEIYYEGDWKAYIDGVKTPILQADYVLRALQLPKGKHVVEFKFEPDSLGTFTPVNLAGSILITLLVLAAIASPFLKPIIEKRKKAQLKAGE